MENTIETPIKEPLFNVPPLTLWLGIVLLICFGILQNPTWFEHLAPILSFIPEKFTNDPLHYSYTVFSYALLHFGWPHIGVNLAGLLAFGSGVERLLNKKHFCFIFIGGVLFGVLGHWTLFPHSTEPLGGASAGISALFGGILPLLLKRRDLIVASLIFVVTNIIFGTVGMPQSPGMIIAWQAHIFGFAFGLIYVLLVLKHIKKSQEQ